MSRVAERLAIIGVGLIGGSVALALREKNAVGEIVGCGRSQANMDLALARGVIDRAVDNPAAVVEEADLVLLCVPVGAMQSVMAEIQPVLDSRTVVTDVGSTKRNIVDQARIALGEGFPRFVPGHPIAGTEKQGVDAAFASLFDGRRVILTPSGETDQDARARVEALWRRCGAVVSSMDAQHHDEVLGATSHLPHVLAYVLVDQLAMLHEKREIFEYAAGGFSDFTRIASSSPEMWRDIVQANRNELLPMLDGFGEKLEQLRNAIQDNDMDTVLACFVRAKAARDGLIGLADATGENPDEQA